MNQALKFFWEMQNVFVPVELESQITVNGGEKMIVSLPIPHPRILIKTIRVTPNIETNVEVQVLDSVDEQNADILYFNDAEHSTGNFKDGIYDMIDIPYEDKDGTQALHVAILNPNSEPVTFAVEVKGMTIR